MSIDQHQQPGLLKKYYPFYSSASYLQSFVLLLFRLSFGWEMYLSGYRHLHIVDKMVTNFQHWGVPFPRLSVYVSGTTEMVGGLLLMAGIVTRLISIPLVFNFLVAILTAGWDNVHHAVFGDGDGRLDGLEGVVNDTAFPFLLVSLATLAFGAGKFSIDYLLYTMMFPKAPPQGFPVGDPPTPR